MIKKFIQSIESVAKLDLVTILAVNNGVNKALLDSKNFLQIVISTHKLEDRLVKLEKLHLIFQREYLDLIQRLLRTLEMLITNSSMRIYITSMLRIEIISSVLKPYNL